jgi:hypothetical protein
VSPAPPSLLMAGIAGLIGMVGYGYRRFRTTGIVC